LGRDWASIGRVPAASKDADARRRAFGEHLRALRDERGLTQEDLAALAAVERKTVNRLETGQHLPRLNAVFRLADALGVRVSELFATV
jgi:transcriptional regulator with XRE-family HTH domain